MKKISMVSFALFMFVFSGYPALAGINAGSIRNENIAEIYNGVSAESNTGNNEASYHKDPYIATGEACSSANIKVVANKNIGEMGGMYGILNLKGIQNTNALAAQNIVELKSNTGNNQLVGRGKIMTGRSVSSANIIVVSNLNVAKVK